jgi:hypothetical protein
MRLRRHINLKKAMKKRNSLCGLCHIVCGSHAAELRHVAGQWRIACFRQRKQQPAPGGSCIAGIATIM